MREKADERRRETQRAIYEFVARLEVFLRTVRRTSGYLSHQG
jgi:hypothetical protein